MRVFLLILFLGGVPDPQTFERLVTGLQASDDFGASVLEAGRLFLGRPYQAGTLEQEGPERLVLRFEGFDCFTLMETAVALARTRAYDQPDLERFAAELQRIRYRNGRIEGYPSRLHYTSDWIRDNEARGNVVDITGELGGVRDERPIDFMSQHRDAYRQLADDDTALAAIVAVENDLTRHPRTLLPKERIAEVEDRIREGDLIALGTSIPGLDVSHVGIATFVSGRLHLLHASSTRKQVVVTREPLADYLADKKKNTGILVYRALAPDDLSP